jgi:hypothetical protein
MTIKRLLISLGRRWYLTVLGVLLTLGLCAAAYLNTQPALQRSASELLVPGTTTIPEGGNPYLYLGGLGQLSDVLVSSLNSERVIGGLQDAYPGTTITVGRDTTTSGPMISIMVSGTDDAAVAGALKAAIARVPQVLTELQSSASVPAEARVSVLTLTSDDTSTVIQKARIETVGTIGVAGIVVTILLVGLVDGLLLGRRQRASKPAPTEGSEAPRESPKRPAKSRKPKRRTPEEQPATISVDEAVDEDVDEQDIDWEYLIKQPSARTERESSER